MAQMIQHTWSSLTGSIIIFWLFQNMHFFFVDFDAHFNLDFSVDLLELFPFGGDLAVNESQFNIFALPPL